MATHPGSALAAATLRHKVFSFRIVELQQVADALKLKKTGRKGELQSRILAYLGELDPTSQAAAALGRTGELRAPREQWRMEQAVKTVNEVYCRMMGLPCGTPNPPSDQSVHSSLQLQPPAGGGSGGVAVCAAAHQQHAAYQYAAAAAYPQQYAQPPAVQQQQQQQQQQHPPGHPQAYQAHLSHMVQQQVQQQYTVPQAQQAVAGRRGGVRCICGSGTERGRMVQCQGRGCGVWQHCDCLGIGQQDTQAARHFRCELCRARLADPFWEVTEQVLPTSQLKPQPARPPVVMSQGLQEVQCSDKVFYLNQQQLEAVQRDPQRHRVQVGCLLVRDEVPLRYHWPKHVDLRINSMPHRPYGRAHNAKMGINQRDDVASIGAMVVRGRNSLNISAADVGTWVLTLQLARQRTLEQVKQLMGPVESLEAAVARVRRQVGGGGGDDSDDDLLISHQVVSLKDPMSGQRMQVPARFNDASGLQAFDLDSFLSMAQRSRKWQDPTTLRNSSVEQLQVDVFMQRVLQCLRGSPAVTDVEISAEGRWRPEGSAGDWLDIAADPASVAASLATAGASRAGSTGAAATAGVKPDPEGPPGGGANGATAGGGAAAAAAAGGATAGGGGGGSAGSCEEFVVPDSEDEGNGQSESEDELEELQKAAAAVRQASAARLDALAGQKRKEPEVIDLLSSDDEDAAPAPAQRQAAPAAVAPQQQQQPRPASSSAAAVPAAAAAAAGVTPLRIRLPVRPRPPANQPPAGQHQRPQQQPPQQQQQQQQPGLATLPGSMWSSYMVSGSGGGMPQLFQQQQQQGQGQQEAGGQPSLGQAVMMAGPLYHLPPGMAPYGTGGFIMASQMVMPNGGGAPQQGQQQQGAQQPGGGGGLMGLGDGGLDDLDNEAFLHALFDDF